MHVNYLQIYGKGRYISLQFTTDQSQQTRLSERRGFKETETKAIVSTADCIPIIQSKIIIAFGEKEDNFSLFFLI